MTASLFLIYSGTTGGLPPVAHVLQQQVGAAWAVIGSMAPGIPLEVTDLDFETEYTFRVRSEDQAGQVVYSSEASFTTDVEAFFIERFEYVNGDLDVVGGWTAGPETGGFGSGSQVKDEHVTTPTNCTGTWAMGAHKDFPLGSLDRSVDWSVEWEWAIPALSGSITGRTFTLGIGTGTTAAQSGDIGIQVRTVAGPATNVLLSETGFGSDNANISEPGSGTPFRMRLVYTASTGEFELFLNEGSILTYTELNPSPANAPRIRFTKTIASSGGAPAQDQYQLDDIVVIGSPA